MKKALLTLVCAVFYVLGSAQLSISVSPGEISGSGLSSSQDIAAYCHITNNSPITIELLWSRSVIDAPQEWTSWVCDMNNCYLPHVSRCPDSQPNTLDPGQSFELSFHAKPTGVEGVAEYMVYFFDLSDTENLLDSVNVTIETSTTSVSDLTGSALRIYPNPTTSYFQINNAENVRSVVVYNMIGNKMREFDARARSRFDVYDLPVGVYLVRILDVNQKVLKTVRLSKR